MASPADEEISYIPATTTTTTTDNFLFGRQKTFAGLQPLEWGFLISSIVNIVVCIAMSIYSLVVLIDKDPTSPDFTLTILVIINGVFCIFYVIYGVRTEKEFEVYIFIGAVLFILTYCILEYSINVDSRSKVKLARLIMGCILGPVNIALAVLVAKEFGWLEFRIVGASEALQIMYREASRYSSLLKFDLQIVINLVLLVLVNGTQISTGEKVTIAVGLPVSCLLAVLGWLSVRRELRWGMIIFCLVGLGVPAYTLFAIYHTYMAYVNLHPREPQSTTLLYATIAAGALALIVRGFLYIEAIKVFRNFGKGLQEKAFEVEANERTSLLAVPRRR